MNVAVILAGGVGSRLGAGIPKQFIKILGKPILAYSIEPFEKHPLIDVILVVCVKSHIDYIDEIKKKYGFKTKIKMLCDNALYLYGRNHKTNDKMISLLIKSKIFANIGAKLRMFNQELYGAGLLCHLYTDKFSHIPNIK